MEIIKKILVLVLIFIIALIFTACSHGDTDLSLDYTCQNTALLFGSVKIISMGNEYESFSVWNHAFFTDEEGQQFSATGMGMRPEEAAGELSIIPFGEDFQIIIEGRPLGGGWQHNFYRLIDDEWILTLRVYKNHRDYPHNFLFITHGLPAGEWEQVDYTELFLELLEHGEYILDVRLWWGNELNASSYHNFFRFVK